MSNKKVVNLFFDVISPYSWFGFEILTRYRNVWASMDLRLRPALLGGIMRAAENKPPAFVPAKARYMTKDIHMLSDFYKVPLKIPKNFFEVAVEKGSLNAMRFVTAVDVYRNQSSDLPTENVSRALWHRIYSSHQDITTMDSLRAAGVSAGLDADLLEKALANLAAQEVKDRLKATTEEIVGKGAFGLPSIVVEGGAGDKSKLLFGSDRIELLAGMLGEKYLGPLSEKSKL